MHNIDTVANNLALNWCCQTINRIQNNVFFVYIIYVCAQCIFIMYMKIQKDTVYILNIFTVIHLYIHILYKYI